MGVKQFCNSLRRIAENPRVSLSRGVARHLAWQGRRLFNLFPFEQRISRSRILAAHGRCGVSALINNQGLYDYDNMRLIQLCLEGGGLFFDIGANIGSYTLVASEQSRAVVYAFEPHPDTFHMLLRNIELNARGNVVLLGVALGAREGVVFLTDRAGSALNHLDPPSGAGRVAVPCRRAEQVCRELGAAPFIVKLDVEGYEYDVLDGFGDYLSSVGVIQVEMNGLSDERSRGAAEIHRLLLREGFRGPFLCRFDARRMVRGMERSPHDMVYCSLPALSKLEDLGFTVATAP